MTFFTKIPCHTFCCLLYNPRRKHLTSFGPHLIRLGGLDSSHALY